MKTILRSIVHVIAAGALVAGAASCKKKNNEAGAPSGATPTATKGTDQPAAPAAAASTGIPECDTYVAAMTKFVTCDKLGPAKDAYAGQLEKDRDGFMHATDKAATAEQCKKAMSDLEAGAKDRGCPLQ